MIKTNIQNALIFAAKKHRNQNRKGTDIPYIVHPAECMQILTELKCDDSIIIAGLLHDTLEDTNTTYEELRSNFGEKVANLVLDVSEKDKKLSWKERKDLYFEHLEKASLDSLYVCFADKLSNMRSIYNDYRKIGNDLWSRFNSGKENQKWFYEKIGFIIGKTEIRNSDLFQEYNDLLNQVLLYNLTEKNI